MSAEFNVDPQTTNLIVEVLGDVAISLGASATALVPAAALVKLAMRLADNGVIIPDNDMLTALQEEMRNRGDLPEAG